MAAEDVPRSSSPLGAEAEALQRLQDAADDMDLPGLAGAKGTGPRLFCGHVPKEVNDEMVRQHFSKWGTVNDVYFPRHKKTLKRRPFCFVTFANKEDAERALTESGLEIGGVSIKNLTMVEDRDKYYTNKHATARQALLQALKQLGPSGAPPQQQSNGSALPSVGGPGVTAEQLSNLAAIMALEGVPSDVVLQTLGLPGGDVAPSAAAMSMPGLGGSSLSSLDGAASLLQALVSPTMSSSTNFDLRTSYDLNSAMRSAGNSLDLTSLQHSLVAAGLAYDGGAAAAGRLHTAESRSTLASTDWSNANSARNSLDMLMPSNANGFLGAHGGGGNLNGLHTRLSLDAALQMQHAQQQAALMVNASVRMSTPVSYQHHQHLHHHQGLPPPVPQNNIASVMHSGFYQPQAAPPPPEPQHSLQSIMSSGLYGAPARHSMHEYGTSMLPFADAGWGAQPGQLPPQQQQQLGGYSTVLRPSIDRAGLPPLPPRSPNQDPLVHRASSSSPDTLLGMPPGGWPLAGQRLAA